MLFLSDRMTSASGSIGGTTFSHNRFGLYTRARRVPVNPSTNFQQGSRAAFGDASAAWRLLTAVQRAGWNLHAANSPVVNKLGSTVFLTGHQWFTATQQMASYLEVATIATPPTAPGKWPISSTTPTVVLDASLLTAAVTGLTAGGQDMQLGLFVGNPVSAGVSFYAGPYTLHSVELTAAGSVTFTAVQARGFLPLTAGMRLPIRLAGFVEGTIQLTTDFSEIVTVLA